MIDEEFDDPESYLRHEQEVDMLMYSSNSNRVKADNAEEENEK